MRTVLLLLLLPTTAWAEDPFGFQGGAGPLDLAPDLDASTWASASECAGCHPDAVAQWTASRHRVSWSNDLMQAGFLAEPRLFCVHCHAPAQEQLAEILPNMPIYTSLSPHASTHEPPPGPLAPEPLADEGISCVVCHLRGVQILTANPPSPDAPHNLRYDPLFGTESACVTCHEFSAAVFLDGAMVGDDQPMQSTVSEWRAWKVSSGRTEDCTTCHMPEGDHTMSGGHDRERVNRAINIRGSRDGTALVVTAQDVGHAVPTGDLFRHLTLEQAPRVEGPWTVLYTFGRSFALGHTGVVPIKRDVHDTRLRPGVPVVVPLAQSGGHWRLRSHLGGPHDEARGLVPLDALVKVIAEGPVGAPVDVSK